MQITTILARQPLFKGLAETELVALAAGTRELRVKRQEILFQKGDSPEGVYLVVMGQIKLFLPSSQGWEKVVHMEGPGSTFGEAVVFLDKPYPVSAQAMQDSILLVVARDTLDQAMTNNVILCRKMLASLSVRMHELLSDIEACTLRSSVQRVICYLSQYAPSDIASYEVALESSRQTIAAQLNLAPETLSRVLTQLAGAGLIEVRGRNISVPDLNKLRAFNP